MTATIGTEFLPASFTNLSETVVIRADHFTDLVLFYFCLRAIMLMDLEVFINVVLRASLFLCAGVDALSDNTP